MLKLCNQKWAIAASVGVTVLLVAGYLSSQEQKPGAQTDTDRFVTAMLDAESALGKDTTQLLALGLVGAIPPGDPLLAKAHQLSSVLNEAASSSRLGTSFAAYKLLQLRAQESTARSAPQVSQIANELMVDLAVFQILQNQRIIGLLEQIARAPKQGQ